MRVVRDESRRYDARDVATNRAQMDANDHALGSEALAKHLLPNVNVPE